MSLYFYVGNKATSTGFTVYTDSARKRTKLRCESVAWEGMERHGNIARLLNALRYGK